MDQQRIDLLFGPGLDLGHLDVDDVDIRSMLLERADIHLDPGQLAMREAIASQIAADDPPEVWQAVERMLGYGSSRAEILNQLALVFGTVFRRASAGEGPVDMDQYRTTLAGLPLPSRGEVEEAVEAIVTDQPGISTSALRDELIEVLDRDPDDEVTEAIVERVLDDWFSQRTAPVVLLAPDRVVHLQAAAVESVLTHRLTEAERESGVLQGAFDLAGIAGRRPVAQPGDHWLEPADEGLGLSWVGPEGWLDAYAPGTLLACTQGLNSLTIEVCPTEPAVDDELVGWLRAAYDHEVAESQLPLDARELVAAVLLDHPDAFDDPQAPLSELAEAAGLEVRGDRCAHDDITWYQDLQIARMRRVADALDLSGAELFSALRVLDVADVLAGTDPAAVPDLAWPPTPAVFDDVLATLRDPEIRAVVLDELFDAEEHEPVAGPGSPAEALASALLPIARRKDQAVVHLLAAIEAEQRPALALAEEHLTAAHQADPDLGEVTDRLAWMASDRGDAATAARLWRTIVHEHSVRQDLEEVEPFATPSGAALGRNEPCWCGSGRKYKQCHLGVSTLPPLPERVGWLARKAVAFLERSGPQAFADVSVMAYTRAGSTGDRDAMRRAMEDPLTLDLVLTEWGWFERFLAARSPLLPDDEALLAASWVLVDRSVHEVTAVRPGEGLTLRDLRTGEEIEVRERTLSREAKAGMRICARPCPDGATHQFIGGVFPVEPGRERDLLDLLDDGDALAIAEWMADRDRPPMLATREGEPMVECRLMFLVPLLDEARAKLDQHYEADEDVDDAWRELHQLTDDEAIVRATLRIDGQHLIVETNSEARADRVRDHLKAISVGLHIGDERTPFDLDTMRRRAELDDILFGSARPATSPPADQLPSGDRAAVLAQVRDGMEQRWCDEPVPALGGLTPREAAADPTRIGELERLLASFERYDEPPDGVSLRPARLRELLGLPGM